MSYISKFTSDNLLFTGCAVVPIVEGEFTEEEDLSWARTTQLKKHNKKMKNRKSIDSFFFMIMKNVRN